MTLFQPSGSHLLNPETVTHQGILFPELSCGLGRIQQRKIAVTYYSSSKFPTPSSSYPMLTTSGMYFDKQAISRRRRHWHFLPDLEIVVSDSPLAAFDTHCLNTWEHLAPGQHRLRDISHLGLGRANE